jgi:hypothetical protein
VTMLDEVGGHGRRGAVGRTRQLQQPMREVEHHERQPAAGGEMMSPTARTCVRLNRSVCHAPSMSFPAPPMAAQSRFHTDSRRRRRCHPAAPPRGCSWTRTCRSMPKTEDRSSVSSRWAGAQKHERPPRPATIPALEHHNQRVPVTLAPGRLELTGEMQILTRGVPLPARQSGYNKSPARRAPLIERLIRAPYSDVARRRRRDCRHIASSSATSACASGEVEG